VTEPIQAIVINHGHIDIEWYKTLDGYRFWVLDIIDRLCDECEHNGSYKTYIFDGAVFLLDDLVEHYPHYEEKIRRLIRKGKLTIGPFYTQFDEWIPAGESMVRNCLWGDRMSKFWGGQPLKAGYLPDNFGHPDQLPQIFRNFGIDSLLFTRGMEDAGEFREFVWEGADGSRLIAVNYPYGAGFIYQNNDPEPSAPRILPYAESVNPSFDYLKTLSRHTDKRWLAEQMIRCVRENRGLCEHPLAIVPMGCDHCPPQSELGETIALANEMQSDIHFTFGTPEDYIACLREKTLSGQYKGELMGCKNDYILFGVLPARVYQKIDIFATETLLFTYALPMTAMLAKLGMDTRNADAILHKAIRNALVNSTHDSVHGSSLDEVHRQMDSRNIFTRQVCAETMDEALLRFAAQSGRWWGKDCRGLSVYNAAGQADAQKFSVWLPIGENDVEILSADGRSLACQVQPPAEIQKNQKGQDYWQPLISPLYRQVDILAPLAPFAMENLAWRIRETKPVLPKADAQWEMENEFFHVRAAENGLIIRDKRTGYVYDGVGSLSDVPDAGDVWDYSPPFGEYAVTRSRILSCARQRAPLSETLCVHGEYSLPRCLHGDTPSRQMATMTFDYQITLWQSLPRMDVKMTLHNEAMDHMTSVEIPLPFETNRILSQGAFCLHERPVVYPSHGSGWVCERTEIFPFREWVAADDGKAGMAVACKGLCAYQVRRENGQTILSLPIGRSIGMMNKANMRARIPSVGGNWPTPDAQRLTDTVIEWSCLPYACESETKAPFAAEARAFLYPPAASCHPRDMEYSEGDRAVYTPFCLEEGRAEVSLLDRSWDKEYFLLRLFENEGTAQAVRLRLDGAKEAWLANMNEEKEAPLSMDGGCVEFTLKPYQIATILWKA